MTALTAAIRLPKQATSSTFRLPKYAATSVTRLTELETVIERGMETFVGVGSALMEIRDQRLYREMGFPTFEDYCRKRWNWSRRHANRQIQAAKIFAVVGPRGPKNEKQARELAGLEPEEIKQVVEKVDFSTMAAHEVRRVVQRMRPTSTIPESRELDGPGSVAEEAMVAEAATILEIAPVAAYLAIAVRHYDAALDGKVRRGEISLWDALRAVVEALSAKEAEGHWGDH